MDDSTRPLDLPALDVGPARARRIQARARRAFERSATEGWYNFYCEWVEPLGAVAASVVYVGWVLRFFFTAMG